MLYQLSYQSKLEDADCTHPPDSPSGTTFTLRPILFQGFIGSRQLSVMAILFIVLLPPYSLLLAPGVGLEPTHVLPLNDFQDRRLTTQPTRQILRRFFNMTCFCSYQDPTTRSVLTLLPTWCPWWDSNPHALGTRFLAWPVYQLQHTDIFQSH